MISARATSGDQVHADSSVVEVHVRELSQLFDSLDPSPFHEKVLDRDAEEYIDSRLKELPKAPAALIVYLSLQFIGFTLDEALMASQKIPLATTTQAPRYAASTFAPTLAPLIVWGLYVLRSRRVKVTFLN